MGVDPVVSEAGGLARKLVAQRLPDTPLPRAASFEAQFDIAATGDTPVWLCVNFEDGNQAWTSPIYLFRD